MTNSTLGDLTIGAIAVLAVLLLVAGGIAAFGNLGAADQRAPQQNGQMGGSMMGGMSGMSGMSGMMDGSMMDGGMMGGTNDRTGGGTSGMGCH